MRPMSEAPRDREILVKRFDEYHVVVHETGNDRTDRWTNGSDSWPSHHFDGFYDLAELIAAGEKVETLWATIKEGTEQHLRALDERDAAKEKAARYENALREIQVRMNRSAWRRDCDHVRRSCAEIGCNGQHFDEIEQIAREALGE